MARIEVMTYQVGIPEDAVVDLMVENVNNEQRSLGKVVTEHTQVWDGPVAEAKESPYYKHFPPFILNQDYNPRLMANNRIKVIAMELADMEDAVLVETPAEPDPELPLDIPGS